MEELGVRQIFAQSPQAKGRVERMAGSFQGRLPSPSRPGKAGLPCMGRTPASERGPLLQASSQDGQGQHGQTPVEHAPTAAQHGATQLRQCAGWRSSSTPTDTCRCVTRATSFLTGMRRRGPACYEPSAGPLAPTPEMVRIVKRLGNHHLSQHQPERLPRRDNSLSGRRCSMPRSKVSPCARSNANWGSRATPCASKPEL